MADRVQCVVIGAGVVGLAVARELAQGGREVLVLEAEGAIGTQTSARNSEVVHSGLYYPTGSLKARLCVQGRTLLYRYCAERDIAHRRTGKLLVASGDAQQQALARIETQARANGVGDVQWVNGAQARALESALRCDAALHAPSTGIIDSHGLMLALQADLEHAGGIVALNSRLALAHIGSDAITLIANDGTELTASTVVNAAGLQAPALAARFVGLAPACVPRAYFAKGHYFALSGRAPFARLIYPVPEPGGLGVHLTLDLAGQARFGPDVQWVEHADDLAVDPQRGQAFYAEIRRYWPALPDGALLPAYAGIRPKISGPDSPASDFCIQGPAQHGVRGLVNLFGIESPGLTSCLAIAQTVGALLG